MTNEITASEDYIDSRDIIARIDYLDDLEDEITDEQDAERELLRGVAAEAGSYSSDWEWGVTLIRDDYFVTYAQELAHDLGMRETNEWPNYCIDWDYAARELQMDYISVTFDGVTYWVR